MRQACMTPEAINREGCIDCDGEGCPTCLPRREMITQSCPMTVYHSLINTTLTMTVVSIEGDRYNLEAKVGALTHRLTVQGYELPLPTDEIAQVSEGDEIEVKLS